MFFQKKKYAINIVAIELIPRATAPLASSYGYVSAKTVATTGAISGSEILQQPTRGPALPLAP